MAKLSDVVGGIMRDLARSHTISDASTVDVFDSYRRDSVLSHLPVPRMSIREARLTLRFAVGATGDGEAAGLEPDELRELWLETVSKRVVPRALDDIGRLDNKRVVAAFERRLRTPGTAEAIDPELLLSDAREETLVASTLRFLARQVEELPPSIRKSVGDRDLPGAFERIVRAEVPELRAAVRELEMARRTSQADLDVLVTSEALAAVPEHQITELVLTVSMEEIQPGTPPDVRETDG